MRGGQIIIKNKYIVLCKVDFYYYHPFLLSLSIFPSTLIRRLCAQFSSSSSSAAAGALVQSIGLQLSRVLLPLVRFFSCSFCTLHASSFSSPLLFRQTYYLQYYTGPRSRLVCCDDQREKKTRLYRLMHFEIFYSRNK